MIIMMMCKVYILHKTSNETCLLDKHLQVTGRGHVGGWPGIKVI